MSEYVDSAIAIGEHVEYVTDELQGTLLEGDQPDLTNEQRQYNDSQALDLPILKPTQLYDDRFDRTRANSDCTCSTKNMRRSTSINKNGVALRCCNRIFLSFTFDQDDKVFNLITSFQCRQFESKSLINTIRTISIRYRYTWD